MLMKLPERLSRAKHHGVSAMTMDLHEEVRLRRFARTARAHLVRREEEAFGEELERSAATPRASLRAAGSQDSGTASEESTLRALAEELARLRRLVDERLPPPP